MKFITFALLCSIILGSLMMSSCSVNYSFTGADIPAEAKTISVTYFKIDGKAALANPLTSDIFTNTLIATMLTQTNLDIVDKNGDLRFSGSIVGYTNTPVAAQSDTETSSRSRLTIIVNVQYVNTIESGKDFEKNFSQFADFDANVNLSEVEVELIEVISENIAQDIFNGSLGSW
jgi:hypothetical protein